MPTRDKALSAVARSMPNPSRPRLSTEFETQLEPLERATAITYADAELASARLHAMAEALVSDGVPDVEILGDTSTVIHVEELRAIATRAPEDP